MPISCAARPDIALSLPVKTLTLSAIEPADRTEATWQDHGRTVAVLHLGWTLERCNCLAASPRRSKELNDGKRVDLSSGAGGRPGTARAGAEAHSRSRARRGADSHRGLRRVPFGFCDGGGGLADRVAAGARP